MAPMPDAGGAQRERKGRAPSGSSLPSGRESPEGRALVLSTLICSVPHPHPLPRLTSGSPPPRAFLCFGRSHQTRMLKSQSPSFYPPCFLLSSGCWAEASRAGGGSDKILAVGQRGRRSDSPVAHPIAVRTPPTLCPLLTDVLGDSRGNGHVPFEYPRIQCFCLLPLVQLASLWTSRRGRREELGPLAGKPLSRWPGGGGGEKG